MLRNEKVDLYNNKHPAGKPVGGFSKFSCFCSADYNAERGAQERSAVLPRMVHKGRKEKGGVL